MRTLLVGFMALLICVVTGCGDPGTANPFVTLAEMSGVGATEVQTGQGGQQTQAAAAFRASMTVTFNNNHPTADLDTSFVAWVDAGSVRTAEQQEELLNSNYVQLSEEMDLGTAETLGVGTYVYNGPGAGHVTAVSLGPAGSANATTSIRLVTPDAMLVFSQPPVSCDSVAFTYSQQGEPLPPVPAGAYGPWSGSTNYGGLKTLAEMNVYQCNPFKPGIFLRRSGGQAQTDEFLEGQDVTFDFNAVPDGNGCFGIVTFTDSGTAAP